jgi:hypothetical protein
LEPEWHETFSFERVHADNTLQVSVLDHDFIGDDDPLGATKISVESAMLTFLTQGDKGRWYGLSGEGAGSGRIYLAFDFFPRPSYAEDRVNGETLGHLSAAAEPSQESTVI